MALSGVLNLTTDTNIDGSLTWSATQNTEGNYSTVTTVLRFSRTNTGYTTSGTGTWHTFINGSDSSVTKAVTITYNSDTYIMTKVTNVPHNNDGTKTIFLDATGGISGTSYTATYGGANITLDTIPRASSITIFDDFTIDGTPKPIVLDEAVSSFTYYVSLYVGNVFIGEMLDVTVPSFDFTLTPSYMSRIYAEMLTSSSITVTLKVTTLSGSTVIGVDTKNAIAYADATVVKPTTTSITATELNTVVSTVVGAGKYVKGLSNIRIAINGETGVEGATIVGHQIEFNNIVYKPISLNYRDTGTLTISGDIVNTNAQVLDSRGFYSDSRVLSPIISILNYEVPKITEFTVERCDYLGVLDELGTYALITRIATATSLMNETEKNSITGTVGSRIRGDLNYVIIPSCTISTTSSASTGGIIVEGYPIENAYEFEFRVSDEFNTTISHYNVAVGTTVMSWSKEGVGIGKVWTSGALDVLGQISFEGDVNINGGTIALYNGLLASQRVGIAIDSSYDAGIINLSNSADDVKVAMYADSASGAGIFVLNSVGSVRSYLTETSGQIDFDNIATEPWVQNYISSGNYTSSSYVADNYTSFSGDIVYLPNGCYLEGLTNRLILHANSTNYISVGSGTMIVVEDGASRPL